MKIIPRNKMIYTFSPQHEPAEYVKAEEPVLIKTEDAFGGQIRREKDSVSELDWAKVDGATGPIFIENAEPGDTLIVEILDIKTEEKGIIVTIPKYGILGKKRFNPATKVVKISNGYVYFNKGVRLKADPMIGTIGVAPRTDEIPTGSLGKHGGNMDVKELTAGTKLYLPVFTEGALFAAGDVHAIQADGESCVSAVEVAGEILLRFSVVKGKKPEWPILETKDRYALLTCGDTLEEAARLAAEATVEAFMREHNWPFEEAYMFGSIVANLEINQVVDPRKGVRAVVSKDLMKLDSLLT
jgi:amidase